MNLINATLRFSYTKIELRSHGGSYALRRNLRITVHTIYFGTFDAR